MVGWPQKQAAAGAGYKEGAGSHHTGSGSRGNPEAAFAVFRELVGGRELC